MIPQDSTAEVPLTEIPVPRWRYKVQQDQGSYALKLCDDGDVIDYQEHQRCAALFQASADKLARELAEAQSCIAELRALDDEAWHGADAMRAELAQANARIAEWERDAARYRFLRDESYPKELLLSLYDAGIHRHTINKNIDAAIAKLKDAP